MTAEYKEQDYTVGVAIEVTGTSPEVAAEQFCTSLADLLSEEDTVLTLVVVNDITKERHILRMNPHTLNTVDVG